MASRKVTTVPTRTTNITGLRICTAGFSWVNESTSAWRTDGAVEEAPRLGDTVWRALAGPG